MKKKEEYKRLPKEFFEDESIPEAVKDFDDDYVPIDWISWVRNEEALGNDVDSEFKKFLGMENNDFCINEEETECKKSE